MSGVAPFVAITSRQITHTTRLLVGNDFDVLSFEGRTISDPIVSDDTQRKMVDGSRTHTSGWQGCVRLEMDVPSSYAHFCHNMAALWA